MAEASKMPESAAELLARIRLAEDSHLELKQVVFAGGKIKGPRRDDLGDDLAAFANAYGGTLVLGVADRTREVIGIPTERAREVVGFVREISRDSVDPPLEVRVESMELPDADGLQRCVVAVDVRPSLFLHKSPGGYFRRQADSAMAIPPNVLVRLIQERSQTRLPSFDQGIVEGAAFEALDAGLLDRFRTPQTEDSREVLAAKLGLAKQAGEGSFVPTVAGVLLASTESERWFPNFYVQAVAYRGASIGDALSAANYQLDAADCRGPLDRQVELACRFVARNQRVAARKTIGRLDIPQYDMAAVLEALVNAVAHRDYSVYGSRIRLRMFEDRLELYSPGAPPNGMELADLAYRQYSRNGTVTSILARCRIPDDITFLESPRVTFMDRRGEGVNVILRRSEEHSGRLPEYELFGNELRLTIFAANPSE